MADLDDNQNYVDPSTVSFWPTAIRYGLIGGLISAVYGLIGNMTGLTTPGGGIGKMVLMGLVGIAITIGVMVYAIKKHRDEDLGGHIPWVRAFLVGLVATVLMSFISTVFNYVYINFIDPSFLDTMMEGMEEMMSGLGLPEEALEKTMEDTRKSFEPGTMFTKGLLTAAGVGAVISAIVAAVMKKSPDQA